MLDDGTAWEAGRLDGGHGPRSLLFGRTYEDPEVELSAFTPGGRVLCIASAGCTAHSLAGRHEVVAVDINPVQLEYARGRLAGAPAQLGKAERVMAAARKLLPLTGVGQPALIDFLQLQSTQEQVERWQALRTARFVFGMDVLFSFTGLRAVYASPFLELLPRRFGRVLLSRIERCFATHPNRDNPYARALFLGEPAPELGPTPGTVELACADAASYLEGQPAGSFSGVSLSNILDGAGDGYRRRLLAAVRHAAAPGSPVVVRSFAEPRDPTEAADAARDRSMLWGSVRVSRADGLELNHP